jgi:hypothetical protein
MSLARAVGAIALIVLSFFERPSSAGIYLVGAQKYQANASGGNIGGTQYTTNNSVTNVPPFIYPTLPLSYEGGTPVGTAISFLLHDGLNSFTYLGTGQTDFTWVGLNFFFNMSGTSYNPDSGALPGDLTVFRRSDNTSTLATPVLNTSILSYASPGFSGEQALANGDATMLLGDRLISIASLTLSESSGAMSFQINVSAVPEAGSLALIGVAVVAAAGWRLRRKLAE